MILDGVLAFVLLLVLIWKRRSHPLNLILLSAFTLTEAVCIGVVVSFYDTVLVLQALLITLGIFLALTVYTLQSSRDFSGMGPFLYISLWAIVLVGLVQLFLPFSTLFDLVVASISAIIFCGYIVFDTYNLMHRVSCEEYVMASIELYLDVLNLFLNILRILSDLSRD